MKYIFFYQNERFTLHKMIDNLISNDLALNELSIKNCNIDSTTLAYVSRFHNLHYLSLIPRWTLEGNVSSDIETTCNTFDWQSLKQLKQLKVLSVSFSSCIHCTRNHFLAHFLNNLGSGDTLQQLSTECVVINDEAIQAMKRFPNLEKIVFEHVRGIKRAHLEMIDSFKRLKELHIELYDALRDESWDKSLIDLVLRTPSLEFLMWGHMDNEEISVEFFNKLVDVVKSRVTNRKLFVHIEPLHFNIKNLKKNIFVHTQQKPPRSLE
jgi:hypothetical protein